MKLKIIHIITRLDKGGSSENVLISCKYFALKKEPVKYDYEIVLIYGGKTKSLDFNISTLNFKTYYIEELQRKISFIKDLVAFLRILNIIKKEKPDIVHTHTSKGGILGRWAAFLLRTFSLEFRNIKIIHTPHGHIFYGYYNKLITFMFLVIEKITAKITDKIVALTDGEKNESLMYGIGKINQWVVIPSGVDYNLQITYHELNNLKEEFNIKENMIIGTVARLEPVKGVRYLIEAIPFICNFLNSSFSFLIVGDGSERKKLEKLLTEQHFKVVSLSKSFYYGQKNNIKIFEKTLKDKKIKVIFTGMRENVVELISIMDIYVQPSLNEGMGKTIVLAQLLGKPVIATKVQGISSVVVNLHTGILVEPQDSKKLAEAVVRLLMDVKLRTEMSSNAKVWVNKIIDGYPQFSIERMIFLLESLYTNIFSTKK
ncbi:MAG: glycosyltransferase [Endomicrobia bacterium]|nr:glycosyltransferase [Endomicrobiia bacterium]